MVWQKALIALQVHAYRQGINAMVSNNRSFSPVHFRATHAPRSIQVQTLGTAAATAEGCAKGRGCVSAPKSNCLLEDLAVLAVPDTPDESGDVSESRRERAFSIIWLLVW